MPLERIDRPPGYPLEHEQTPVIGQTYRDANGVTYTYGGSLSGWIYAANTREEIAARVLNDAFASDIARDEYEDMDSIERRAYVHVTNPAHVLELRDTLTASTSDTFTTLDGTTYRFTADCRWRRVQSDTVNVPDSEEPAHRYCVDCRHAHFSGAGDVTHPRDWRCVRPALGGVSMVTGRHVPMNVSCEGERLPGHSGDTCGREGTHWEARERNLSQALSDLDRANRAAGQALRGDDGVALTSAVHPVSGTVQISEGPITLPAGVFTLSDSGEIRPVSETPRQGRRARTRPPQQFNDTEPEDL